MANIYVHKVATVSDEATAAKNLKKILAKELDGIDGNIWIVPSIDVHPATGRHDVDLLLIGYLKDYYVDEIGEYSNIAIKSFIATIEVKSHDVSGVHKYGTDLYVDYSDGPKCVTTQSNEQKETLKKFLYDTLNYKQIRVPFIANLIWLVSVSKRDFDESVGLIDSNVLCSDSTAIDFFDAIGRQFHLMDNGYVASFRIPEQQIHIVADIFCAKSNGADSMTLRRMNLMKYEDEFLNGIENRTEKMIVLGGHAGTGKTIRLLKAADKLSKLGKKCLFLTYNTALIADLNHTLKFISNKNNPLLKLESMYSFFIGIMRQAGVWKNNSSLDQYSASLTILFNKKATVSIPLDYDYIFVDEAQDWMKKEADLLLHFSGQSRIVIADGIDQFMKSGDHTEWGPFTFPKLKVNLRQRSNLVNFAKIFASKLGVYWDVESSMDIPGGRVIVTRGYEKELHDKIYSQAKFHGCTAYDIMFLAANSMVKSGHFDPIEAYKSVGINLFDGVDKATRDSVYGEQNRLNEECRVYTYESCRGLEAWTVICLRFDQLFSKEHPHDYHEITYSAAKNYMLGLWSLIPLSRAIDTLVLAVAKDTPTDLILREIASETDYIEYPND